MRGAYLHVNAMKQGFASDTTNMEECWIDSRIELSKLASTRQRIASKVLYKTPTYHINCNPCTSTLVRKHPGFSVVSALRYSIEHAYTCNFLTKDVVENRNGLMEMSVYQL
jgi:ribosomal protein S27E